MSTITAAQRQAILDLETQVQTLKSVFAVTNLPPPPPPPSALTPALLTTTAALPVAASTGTRKKKVNVGALPTAPVVKKGISSGIQDLNKERMAVYLELKEAWIAKHPELADVARAAWAEGATGAQKKALTAAIRAAAIESPPSYADALQEHAKRRAAANEGQAAKYAAYRAKVEAQQKAKLEAYKTAAALATTTAVTPALLSAEPLKTTPLVVNSTPKVVPPPAPAPAPTSPNVRVSIVRANNANAEAFKTWEHEGTMYFKNGLNYVYKKTSKGGFGDYVGRFDPATNTIDTSVPEPEPSNSESNNTNLEGGRRKTRRNRKHRKD